MCLKDEAPCEIWTHVYWVETSNANHYTNGTNKRCWTKTFQMDFKFNLLLDFRVSHLKGISYTLDYFAIPAVEASPVRHYGEWFFSFCGEPFLKPHHQITKSIMERRILCKLNPIRKTLAPKHNIKIIIFIKEFCVK